MSKPVPAATPTAAPEAAKPVKVKKPKSPRYVVRLRDAGKNTLRFTAKQREKDAVSFATYTTRNPEGKATSKRGASATHATFDEAKVAVDGGTASAVKLGWIARKGGGGGGGGSRKDTFSLADLPAPKQ